MCFMYISVEKVMDHCILYNYYNVLGVMHSMNKLTSIPLKVSNYASYAVQDHLLFTELGYSQ